MWLPYCFVHTDFFLRSTLISTTPFNTSALTMSVAISDNDEFRRAVQNADLAKMKILLQRGVNIHLDYDYALYYSVHHGHLEVVKYLVEKNANMRYILRIAAENGHLEVVKFLVDVGADIHENNDYAVRRAAWNGRLEVVKLLVDKGADIRADKCAALRYSARFGHLEMVAYFMYETCFSQTKDFEFKCDLIKNSIMGTQFNGELSRRMKIQLELAEKISQHALQFHLRPTSLRVLHTGVYFGQDSADRKYWE